MAGKWNGTIKTLDSPKGSMQSRAVQSSGINRSICEYTDIDARDQLPTGRLNTPRRILLGYAPRGSCLYPDNKGYSHFLLLNRRTVRRHRLIGTCAAPLRRVLRVGHAGTSKPTGQQDRENDSPFYREVVGRMAGHLDRKYRWVINATDGLWRRRVKIPHSRPEDCGFLFLFLFRSDNSHMKRLGDNSTYFFRGAFFVFSLFLSLLVRLGV